MADLSDTQIHLLKVLAKPIVHMRKQHSQKRFGLVFGAGIGKDVDFPNWDKLVERIADHPEVKGSMAIKDLGGTDNSLTIKIQRLFEFYKKREASLAEIKIEKEKIIIRDWRKILVECLYEGSFRGGAIPNVSEKHPYLGAYENIIKESEVTINYNFDDTIQVMLQQGQDKSIPSGYRRQYKTISKGPVRPRQLYSLIYHPNGFLPRNLLESSDQIVLSEESFADQLLQLNQQKEDFLLNHFTSKTCLLIGLSLNDPNLKHILRQSATLNPGHCHYYVCFDEGSGIDAATKEAVRRANFQVYNLITLFLGRAQLKDLGVLLSEKDHILKREAESANIKLKFFYYVTGPMGVGKSTCISHLYSISSYDEWTQERLPELGKDRNTLDAREQEDIDRWLEDEFYRKNYDLSQVESGIYLIDRPPLDPLSFTDEIDWPKKAKRLKGAIIQSAEGRKIQAGHVFLLLGEPKELQVRIISQNKLSSISTIKQNQEFLKRIYRMDGVTQVDTRYLGISEVTRFISTTIHLEQYKEANLHTAMERYASKDEHQAELALSVPGEMDGDGGQ